MNLFKKITSFLKLSELHKKEERHNYQPEKFQQDLLSFNKVIRKAYFNYEEHTFNLAEIYKDSEKNLKAGIKFSNGKGSVTYTFKDHNNNELATIFTDGRYHTISMNDVKILNKDQINDLFNTLELNKVFNNITKTCQEEKTKQKVIAENYLVESVVGKSINNVTNKDVSNYKKNNDIYFNLVNLSLDTLIKEKKLDLSNPDNFLNYNLSKQKADIIRFQDFKIDIEEFKHESITLNINSEKTSNYLEDGDDGFYYRVIKLEFSKLNEPFLELKLTYHQDQLLKEKNNSQNNNIGFNIIEAKKRHDNEVEITSEENKNKILNFIQISPLLENTITLLQQENLKLDKLITEKEIALNANHEFSTNVIGEKLNDLKEKLNPPKFKK